MADPIKGAIGDLSASVFRERRETLAVKPPV